MKNALRLLQAVAPLSTAAVKCNRLVSTAISEATRDGKDVPAAVLDGIIPQLTEIKEALVGDLESATKPPKRATPRRPNIDNYPK